VEFGESPTTGPVVQNNCIYVGTAKGIMAHGIANGDRLWLAHMGSVRGALAVESKRIAAVDDQGKCIVVDATTGKVLNSFMGVLPEVAPVLTRDAALFAAEKNFMHWRFEAEDAAFWMDISWMGKISTPPVLLSDSRLYFVTEKFGLVRAGSSR